MPVSFPPPGMPPLPPAGRRPAGDGDEQYYGFDLSEQVLKAVGITPRIKSDLEYLLGLGKKLTSSEMSDYYIDFMSEGHKAFQYKPPRPILPLISVLPKWLLEKRLTNNLKYEFLKILDRPSGDDKRDYDSQYGRYHYAVMILALLEAKSKTEARVDKDFIDDCIKFCCSNYISLREPELKYAPFLQSFLIDAARNLGNACSYKPEISWMINRIDNFKLFVDEGQQVLSQQVLRLFPPQAESGPGVWISSFHDDQFADHLPKPESPEDRLVLAQLQERTKQLRAIIDPDQNPNTANAWNHPLAFTLATIRKKGPTKIYIDANTGDEAPSYKPMFKLIRACCNRFDIARLDMKRWLSGIADFTVIFRQFNLLDTLNEQQVKDLIKEFLDKDQTCCSKFQDFIKDDAPNIFQELEKHLPAWAKAINKIKGLQLSSRVEVQDLFEPTDNPQKKEIIIYDSVMSRDPEPTIPNKAFVIKNIPVHLNLEDDHPDYFFLMLRNVLRELGRQRRYASDGNSVIVAVPINKALRTFACSLDQEKLAKYMRAEEFCKQSDVILVHFYNTGDDGGGDEVTVDPVLDPVLIPA